MTSFARGFGGYPLPRVRIAGGYQPADNVGPQPFVQVDGGLPPSQPIGPYPPNALTNAMGGQMAGRNALMEMMMRGAQPPGVNRAAARVTKPMRGPY